MRRSKGQRKRQPKRTVDEVRRHPRWGATKAQGEIYQEIRDLKNEIHKLEVQRTVAKAKDKMDRVALARYIFHWLEVRNRDELAEAFRDQKVGDRRRAIEELERILECGGHPPNWAPLADPHLASGKWPE